MNKAAYQLLIAAVLLIAAYGYQCKPPPKDLKDYKLNPTGFSQKLIDSITIDSLFKIAAPNYQLKDTLLAEKLLFNAKKINGIRAKELANKAKEIYIHIYGKTNTEVAKIYNFIGLENYHSSNLIEAQNNIDTAINIIKAIDIQHSDIVNYYLNLANVYLKAYKADKVKDNLIWAQNMIDEDPFNFKEEKIKLFNKYGQLYIYLRNYEKAIEYFNLAIEHSEEHPVLKGKALVNIGIVYFYLGDYWNMIKHQKEALIIAKKNKDELNEFLPGIYSNLTIANYALGNFEESIEYGEKGISIIVENSPKNQLRLLNDFVNISGSYAGKGAYNQAIEYNLNALALAKTYLGDNHPHLIKINYNLGNCYFQLEDHNQSMDYLQKSEKIVLSNSDKKLYDDLLMIYSMMGSVCAATEKYDSSIWYTEKALNITLEHKENNSLLLAQHYGAIGTPYSYLKKYNLAESYFQKALNLRKNTFGEKGYEVSRSYLVIGDHYLRKKDYKEAHNNLDRALFAIGFGDEKPFNYISNFRLLNYILDLKLKSFIVEYNQTEDVTILKKAQKFGQKALKAIVYQNKTPNPYSETFSARQFHPIYENLIIINSKLSGRNKDSSYITSSFSYAEAAKTVIPREMLQNSKALQFANIPDSLIQLEGILKKGLNSQIKKRKDILDKGINPKDTLVLNLSKSIFDMTQKYRTFIKSLEQEYPNYYKAKYNLTTISIDQIQNDLLEPNQVLLEYMLGDSAVYLFLVKRDTFLLKKIDMDYRQVDGFVNEMRKNIEEQVVPNLSDSLFKEVTKKYVKAANQLYIHLFAPIKKYLPRESEVIVIPDGSLGYLPFDALLESEPNDINDFPSFPFLLKKYSFSYAQSATLLKEMKQKKHIQKAHKNLLAFAPNFEGGNIPSDKYASRSIASEQEVSKLSELNYNIEEAQSIVSIIGGKALIGINATETQFKANANQYKILHLSTHGIVNDQMNDYSFIAFTIQKDSIENELLYNRELYDLSLNADMVVLSACETGLGKILWGEGITNLTRGFSFAGAKSIIPTLWRINDQSTSNLMENFYKELKAGKKKDKALRQAKLDFLYNSPTYEPYYWAAFIPVGDMQPLIFDTSIPIWAWILGGIIICSLGGFVIHLLKQR